MGDPDVWVEACGLPEAHVGNDDDCDDRDPAVGAPEPLFEDRDADGWGVGTEVVRCPAPGWAETAGDCDDTIAAVGPEQALFSDGDGDGWGTGSPEIRCPAPGWAPLDDDCDDAAPAVNPGVPEVMCTGLDDDCDLFGTPDGPVATTTEGAFDTVQAALDETADDLRICPGVEGGWVIRRPVVIEAVQQGGLVNAPALGPTVVIEGGGAVTLEGMVIEGGSGDPLREDLGGSVSNLDPATTVVLDTVVILGGAADRGGAVGSYGPLLLVDVEISDGIATEGGGIWAGDALTASGTLIETCEADRGGGIYAAGPVTLDQSVISANTADEFGGGLVALDAVFLSNGTEIAANSSDAEGGGVYLDALQVADATGAIIHDNTATEGAGVWSEDATWIGGTIRANHATYRGGGVYCIGESTLADVLIEGNDATEEGGGIFWHGAGDLYVDASTIQGNDAGSGGGLLARVTFDTRTITLTDSRFLANTALHGAGLALQNANTIGVGVTEISGGTASFEGGGVALYHAALSGVTLADNHAASGGGVAALADPTFDDAPAANALVGVLVEGNSAVDGAGLFVGEGQRLPIDPTSAVTGNTASRAGGGAYLDGDDSELVSTGADFGTGATDNTPDDVSTSAGVFELGPGATTCTGDGGCD